ncbi:hypothetical protein RIF29_09675 [Crotalaria pallida]|uniref:Uncharacterized protein n=1 Tax=Crotalaria pallida TaxID=3830 RepID=A0AAN9FZP1_CROPI
MASSSFVSLHEFKECCPPPAAAGGVVFDEGVSDDEDVCFCVPFPWLLQYHGERLGKPDLTETQLWDYFREDLKNTDFQLGKAGSP